MGKKLTLSQEAKVLFWLENYKGKIMKGDSRELLYEIYSFFNGSDGRTSSVCSCLDRDTHRKVEGYINEIEWSKDTIKTPKLKGLLPDIGTYEEEEESTQPVKVDIKKVARAIKKRKQTKKKK